MAARQIPQARTPDEGRLSGPVVRDAVVGFQGYSGGIQGCPSGLRVSSFPTRRRLLTKYSYLYWRSARVS